MSLPSRPHPYNSNVFASNRPMASTANTRANRPTLPGHHSFNSYAELKGPSIACGFPASITYEGYNITPRDPEYHRPGRWCGANTRSMVGTEEEFKNLVQKQLLSDSTVTEVLYSSRMDGSKRDYIEDFLNRRNTSRPKCKHQLAYLKLEQHHKPKSSKSYRGRTASMQIILECKLYPGGTIACVPSAPIPHQASVGKSVSLPLSSSTSTRTSSGTVPSLKPISLRPEYQPSYVLEGKPNSNANPLHVTAFADRDRQIKTNMPRMLSSICHDSDDSEYFTSSSSSPSCCLSPGTVEPSSQRMSGSPVSTATRPYLGRRSKTCNPGQGGQNFDRRYKDSKSTSPNRGDSGHPLAVLSTKDPPQPPAHGNPRHENQHFAQRHSHLSVGTQTELKLPPNDSIIIELVKELAGQAADKQPRPTDGEIKSVASKNQDLSPRSGLDDIKRLSDHEPVQEVVDTDKYEKPSWMNNLQPGQL